MKRRDSLFYKILLIFSILGTVPALLVSLRLLYYTQALLLAGGNNWSVPPQAIEQIRSALIGQILTYIIYSLIMVSIGAIFMSGVLMRPIRALKDLMESFLGGKPATGTLPARQSGILQGRSADEFGQLSISLQQVMSDLTQLRQELETQVQERTQALEHRARQMQAAAAVAQDSASIRDLDQLLFKVTQLIAENFGYYHVGIFLLDEKQEFAILRATNSLGGQQMLVRGHKLSVAQTSIVGHVANTRQPRVALSVGADAVHFKNPYLPETRSEMALPLITGGGAFEAATEPGENVPPEQFSEAGFAAAQRLWGVLDVQSKSEQAFNQDDIAVLQVLANQIAIAIENAQLFIENQKALAELQNSLETSRKLYGEMTGEAWRKLLQARPETGYIASSSAASSASLTTSDNSTTSLSPVEGEWPPDMVIASQSGQSLQSDAYTLVIPIRMREMTAGVLRLRKAENAPPWSRSEIDLMNTLTEQLGVALESARLYDETRRRAERERLTGEITARLRSSNDPQVILQTAMDELRHALQISQARVMVQKVGDGAAFRMTNELYHPYVIAIANQKGGVAKTTTVVSLGGALVNHNKEVLLVDLDAQANLTLSLGKDPGKVRGVISQVFFNAASLNSVSRDTVIPGLDLVPSNADMDTAERFLPLRKNHETILRRAIRGQDTGNLPKGSSTASESEAPIVTQYNADDISLKSNETTDASDLSIDENPSISDEAAQLKSTLPSIAFSTLPYDFILLDCPPFIGAVTLNAIVAADMLLIPTQPEFFSAHALRTMMLTIKQVRNQFNPSLIYRILVTMLDRRNRIHRQVDEQIRQTFGNGVLKSLIEIDTKLRESAVQGVPVTHHPAASRAHPPRSALQYEALAQELIDYVESR